MTSERNFRPTSLAPLSPESIVAGVYEVLQMEHGHDPGLTVTLVGGFSMFPLSSIARDSMLTDPRPPTVPVYVQFARPFAGCHVTPPSSDTSTLATLPAPASVAVPVTVSGLPRTSSTPGCGDVMVVVGGVVSVDSAAGARAASSDPGWEPMSARRLTIACCIRGSDVPRPYASVSRPYDQYTVPPPKTSAPLGAR